jgi:hypothetical protein
MEGIIEPAQAPESCGHGYLRHRQAGVMQQLFGKEQAPGLSHRDGRGAEMPSKEPAQLTLSHSNVCPKGLDRSVLPIEKAFGD